MGDNTASEPAHVCMSQGFLVRKAVSLSTGIWRGNGLWLQQREDFLFNCQFARVRQFVTIAGKYFDPVVRPWIVRRRDDDSGVELLRARQKGYARCRDDTRAARLHANPFQPLQKTVGDPLTGNAPILADYYAGLGVYAQEVVTKRTSNPI